jgi:hypothetical protein
LRHPDEASNMRFEQRKVLLDHRPGGIEIDLEVGVDQTIARAGDLPSRDSGFGRGQFGAELPDRFADDLDLAHDDALRLEVRQGPCTTFEGEAFDCHDRFEDVAEEKAGRARS